MASFHPVPRRPRRGTGDDRAPRADIAADPDADPYAVARKIVLDQLTAMPRSRAELAAKLAQRNVEPDVAEAVLDRMEEVNLVDDAQFAQLWVSARHRSKGLATRSIAMELRRKGIDPEIADEALQGLDSETELDTARRLVERKLAATAGDDPQRRVRRLVGLLARKGYSSGVAYRVVREALDAEGTTLETDLPLE